MNWKLSADQRKVVFGALIAAAFFLIEAGIVEIILSADLACRRNVASLRLSPDPFTACIPEWQWLFLHSASRGFLWLVNSTTPALLAGLVMGMFYAIVGAVSTSIFKSRGIVVFLIVHVFLVAALAGLSYLGRYIA